jgi:Heavy metal binding domain
MIRVVVALIAAAALVTILDARQRDPAAGIPLRFHHLHYLVDDPGAALGRAADRLDGARAIVQGLGVGVRVGREYVLFDRDYGDRDRQNPAHASSAAHAYDNAVHWLAARGFTVRPRSLAETSIPESSGFGSLDHLAFAADDLAAAVAHAATTPLATTESAARFRLPTGATIEIVRDTDRPDTHWCPMHPDVRSASDAKCRICGMALVKIPPPRVGEYRLDVTLIPRRGGGISGLRFMVRDPETNDRVPGLMEVHERPFHLFVISRDLATFAHLHPVLEADGSLRLEHELPAGEYMLVADFLPAGGTPQMVQRAVVTPGYPGPLFAQPADIRMIPAEHEIGGLRVRMQAAPPAPRRETLIRFELSDMATRQPVTDLEPYLGASGHLLIVNQDLTAAVHGHPEGAGTRGPSVTFGPVFPAPGRYKLWVQFQRHGAIVTAPFVIDVPSESR